MVRPDHGRCYCADEKPVKGIGSYLSRLVGSEKDWWIFTSELTACTVSSLPCEILVIADVKADCESLGALTYQKFEESAQWSQIL